MAIHSNLKDLSIEVIDEYLTAAKACVDTRKSDGGILGYPATLLLLCVTDAIGHSLKAPGKQTRLAVLRDPIFGSNNLNKRQIDKLTSMYRHRLAHNGLIAPGVYLTAEENGLPFEFDDDGMPTLIRVPVLYDRVKRAWECHRGAFEPPDLALPKISPRTMNFVSTFSAPASGIAAPTALHLRPGKKK